MLTTCSFLLVPPLGRLLGLLSIPMPTLLLKVHHLGAVIDVLVLVLVPFAHQALSL